MSAGKAQGRPVRLEVNATGLWHSVCSFEADDVLAEAYIRDAVPMLCAIDRATTFRVITRDMPPRVLLNYSNKHGWTEGK